MIINFHYVSFVHAFILREHIRSFQGKNDVVNSIYPPSLLRRATSLHLFCVVPLMSLRNHLSLLSFFRTFFSALLISLAIHDMFKIFQFHFQNVCFQGIGGFILFSTCLLLIFSVQEILRIFSIPTFLTHLFPSDRLLSTS